MVSPRPCFGMFCPERPGLGGVFRAERRHSEGDVVVVVVVVSDGANASVI